MIREHKQRRRRQWKKKKKISLRSLKLNHLYLDPLNLSNVTNVSNFSFSLIRKNFIYVQKEKRKFVAVCLRPP